MKVAFKVSGIKAELAAINTKLDTVLKMKGEIMAAIDDLKAAIAALNTSVSDEIAAVSAKIASFAGAVPAADAETIVSQLNTLKQTVDNETAAISGTPTGTP